MSRPDYAKMFDLNAQEQSLDILICAKDGKEPSLPKATFLATDNLLPSLPFSDQSFDLVLCPNILFVEDHHHGADFHRDVLKELSRIGNEVRVFPLVDEQGQPAHYLGVVVQALQDQGYGVELRQISSKDQNTASNAMLRLWNTACPLRE